MIPGFKRRLSREIKHFMTEYEEFEPLKSIVDLVTFPSTIYAPNIQAWVGASILMSLGQEVDKFLITLD